MNITFGSIARLSFLALGVSAGGVCNAGYTLVATDTLTWAASEMEIIATGNAPNGWNATGTMLKYAVEVDTTAGLWRYTYEWDTSAKGLSHLIVELSSGLSFTNGISSGTTGEIMTYSPSDPGNSNPGLPGSIYGIKWNGGGITNPAPFTLVTTRAPQWGDFYAKDGRDKDDAGAQFEVAAWNHGFGTADLALTTADFNALLYGVGSFTYIADKVLRPDTQNGVPPCQNCDEPPPGVPEPGTLALFGLALGVFGWSRYRVGCKAT